MSKEPEKAIPPTLFLSPEELVPTPPVPSPASTEIFECFSTTESTTTLPSPHRKEMPVTTSGVIAMLSILISVNKSSG